MSEAEGERLQKVLARVGYGSREHARLSSPTEESASTVKSPSLAAGSRREVTSCRWTVLRWV